MSIAKTKETFFPKLSKQILHEILSYIYPMCINCKKFVDNDIYINNLKIDTSAHIIMNLLKFNNYEHINKVRTFLDHIASKKNTYVNIKYNEIKSVIRANNHIEVNDKGYVATSYHYSNNNECSSNYIISEKLIKYIFEKFRNNISCSKECCKKSKNKTILLDIDKIEDESESWIYFTENELEFNDEFMEKYDNIYMPFGDNNKTLRNIYRYDHDYIYDLVDDDKLEYKLNEYPIIKEFLYDIKNYDTTGLGDIIYLRINNL